MQPLSSKPNESPIFQLPNSYRTMYGSFYQLHGVQKKAIAPILLKKDLILLSETGSGKTEAVLAPCIEQIIQSGFKTAMIYIVPTRALANDIARRFRTRLRDRLNIHLNMRTGDMKSRTKERTDIMITTPESFDVMIGSRSEVIRSFLIRVSTIIIDEVHAFVHLYRGRHLSFLIHRLETRKRSRLQKIALSATISHTKAIRDFFNFDKSAVILKERSHREILPRLIHLKKEKEELSDFLDDLYYEWSYRKILIFANSRGRCDLLYQTVNTSGCFKGACELHYSNLTTHQRKAVETRFRKSEKSICVATSTLELGIDIGDVDAVILYEPPDTVSAFLQRIGRANRRDKKVQFWGISRGENAGSQLIRFLAIYHLALQGQIEKTPDVHLLSVLSQQIISALYEKKRLSLPSLTSLFSTSNDYPINDIVDSLLEKRWLRKDSVDKLFYGGFRYRDALLDYKIWSNFPESEETYALIFDKECIADIPHSIVRQLDLGDRVRIAGKKMKVLNIDTSGSQKQVIAEKSLLPTTKDIVWIGLGCLVSYEVAQSIKTLLENPHPESHETILFSRTRHLYQMEIERLKNSICLKNGITVTKEASGFYYFRTYLGAVANLILEWSIKTHFSHSMEAYYLRSDEVGIESSRWIPFKALNLPTDTDMLRAWVNHHFKMIHALFPLNLFCKTLPKHILIQELSEFMYDPRIFDAFKIYRNASDDILSGSLEALDNFEKTDTRENYGHKILEEINAANLLEEEKSIWKSPGVYSLKDNPSYEIKPVTGTLILNYIRLKQCNRWLGFQFLPKSQRSFLIENTHDEMAQKRMAQGEAFESDVIDFLCKDKENHFFIKATDQNGSLKTMGQRSIETVETLKTLIDLCISGEEKEGVLFQGVIVLKTKWNISLAPTDQKALPTIGIPDLIHVRKKDDTVSIEIGDIKSSIGSRYHQKWQIAFYAALFKKFLRDTPNTLTGVLSDEGVIYTRSEEPFSEPQCERFDLKPFLTAIPYLLSNIHQELETPPLAKPFNICNSCLGCSYYSFCYKEALFKESIQLIPHHTIGFVKRLHHLNLKTWGQLLNGFEPSSEIDPEKLGAPQQRERIYGRTMALDNNHVIQLKKTTKRYPRNISSNIFLDVANDPATGFLKTIGLMVIEKKEIVHEKIWEVSEKDSIRKIWYVFRSFLISHWKSAIQPNKGPHIFYFGQNIIETIKRAASHFQDPLITALLTPSNTSHSTDLKDLFKALFYLPIPGRITLYALGRIFGISSQLTRPKSFYHPDPIPESSDQSNQRHWMCEVLSMQKSLFLFICSQVKSSLRKEEWRILPYKESELHEIFKHLIENERALKEEDLAQLNRLPLKDRVERFRAMGPLAFVGTTLDDEGHFLYQFRLKKAYETTRFRNGDFLKLAHPNLSDLQSGSSIILENYNLEKGILTIRPLKGRLMINKDLVYSLEEDGTDWNTPKLIHILKTIFQKDMPHSLLKLFDGSYTYGQSRSHGEWAKAWIKKTDGVAGLNQSQKRALKLPFKHSLSVIEGPPGTGKTHLLTWVIVSLMYHAHESKSPLKIVVSALTHHAIDQVLEKVASLMGKMVKEHSWKPIPAKIIKWGKFEKNKGEKSDFPPYFVESADTKEEVFLSPCLILGATGYGLYTLFQSHKNKFPKVFDWVIFDEASQILIPQALLSLIYGKGNFLLLGDTKQLPPVVKGRYDADVAYDEKQNHNEKKIKANHSLLEFISDHYPKAQCEMLDRTYRMNRWICEFPARMWYENRLLPADANAKSTLAIQNFRIKKPLDHIIDPLKPITLILLDHENNTQESIEEAALLSQITERLIRKYHMRSDRMALITPHRAQNSAIKKALTISLNGMGKIDLPLIDTVERAQGMERDVILFGITTSDTDQVMSEFLNSPNRFNVAMTRAKTKFIIVGSRSFFFSIPPSEDALVRNQSFKTLLEYLDGQKAIIFWD